MILCTGRQNRDYVLNPGGGRDGTPYSGLFWEVPLGYLFQAVGI